VPFTCQDLRLPVYLTAIMRPVTVIRTIRCRNPRQKVWEHLSNTLRLNRAVGTSRLTVVPRETKGLDRFELRGRLGGFRVAYLEEPFAWSEAAFFALHRIFLNGPAQSLATRYDLADAPGGSGCEVTVRVDVVPRATVLRPLIWFATRRTLAEVAVYLASIDDSRASIATSPADGNALDAARSRIEGEPGTGLVTRLVEYVGNADDLDLVPIRPFALARAWSVDRLSLLRLCLASVPAGLLELRWGLVCPNCRTTSQVLPSLRDLEGRAHCHACDLRYDSDLDRAVEAQFFPHPLVRNVSEQPYCIGGPALTPHVIAQVPVQAGAEGVLLAPAEEGRLRLFVRGGAVASVDVVSGAPASVDMTLAPADVAPAHVLVGPRGTLRLYNRSGEGRHAQLQRSGWLADAATAHDVAAMPEFRRLFGAEALRPGLALKVAQVAILFADICGSTALYARVGDASAFGLVMDCIVYESRVVERHRGAVVKTIGDAVMAAFADPRDAAAAGAEMIVLWTDFARDHPLAASIDLKVGIYAGPCTIVKANQTLDYFGQTVNAAARIQHLAGPRELVLGESLANLVPAESGIDVVEAFAAKVKGIDEPLRAVRFRPRP
jgi:adenylate cyclase